MCSYSDSILVCRPSPSEDKCILWTFKVVGKFPAFWCIDESQMGNFQWDEICYAAIGVAGFPISGRFSPVYHPNMWKPKILHSIHWLLFIMQLFGFTRSSFFWSNCQIFYYTNIHSMKVLDLISKIKSSWKLSDSISKMKHFFLTLGGPSSQYLVKPGQT